MIIKHPYSRVTVIGTILSSVNESVVEEICKGVLLIKEKNKIAVLEEGDVYSSSNGSWKRCPLGCIGLPISPNTQRVVWVRPL